MTLNAEEGYSNAVTIGSSSFADSSVMLCQNALLNSSESCVGARSSGAGLRADGMGTTKDWLRGDGIGVNGAAARCCLLGVFLSSTDWARVR